MSDVSMLRDEFVAVLQADTHDDLRAKVINFTQQLGFQIAMAVSVVDRLGTEPVFMAIDNAPPACGKLFEAQGLARRSAVLQHCKRHSVPITWSQQSCASMGDGALWETSAPFGLGNGIALAMHLPGGRHFILAAARDQPLSADPDKLSRVAADLHLFAVHAQDAAFRLLTPELLGDTEAPSLTPRELECLRWTMAGKTAWELGRILGISEQTAVRHVNNAMHKLGCVNKHQAVVKALRLELIA